MPSTVRGIVISDVRRFPPAGGEQQEYQKYSWKQVRKNMGKIFYMMGKSSSGKDTIFKEILKKGIKSAPDRTVYDKAGKSE